MSTENTVKSDAECTHQEQSKMPRPLTKEDITKRKSKANARGRIDMLSCYLNCAGYGDEPVEFIVDFRDNLTDAVYVNCFVRFENEIWLGPSLPVEVKNDLGYSRGYLTEHKMDLCHLVSGHDELIQAVQETLAYRWKVLTERLTELQDEATDKSNMYGAFVGMY